MSGEFLPVYSLLDSALNPYFCMNKKFLIQTIKGKVVHDFAFTLERALEYQAWRGEKFETEYIEGFIENYPMTPNIIPIGTIEFVHFYLSLLGINPPPPLNVPRSLIPWALGVKDDMNFEPGKEYYYKSTKNIKDPSNGSYVYPDYPPSSIDLFQVREYIPDIISEWRGFIYRGDLVGLHNYFGDFTCYPDIKIIQECIKAWTEMNKNKAYTLDFGISEEHGTFVLEAHRFYSCGLYGFSDYQILPWMFIRTWNGITKNTIVSE